MKKLQKIKKLVSKLNSIEDLTNFGFVKRKVWDSSCGVIYIHQKKRIVVKMPNICYGKPRAAITTVRFWKGDELIFIQPLCCTKKSRLAQKLLGIDMGLHGDCHDLHSGNVGWYKGKPVVFDW